MTTQYDLFNTPLAISDVNLDMWLLNQASFKKVGETATPNLIQVDYVYAAYDPAYRVTLRVTTQIDKTVNPNNLVLMRRTTMKLTVPVVRSDDEGAFESTRYCNCEFWQGYAVPADEKIAVAEVAKWLTSNTGLFFPSYTAGVPSHTTLTTLAYRHTSVFG